MKREWKPGDVAAWDLSGQVEVIFRCLPPPTYAEEIWQTVDGGEGYPKDEDIRPLVVIDPEDAVVVQQLRKSWLFARNEGMSVGDALTYALREFANPKPPRIDEPSTWGVVEASCVHSPNSRAEWVRFPSGNWHTVHEVDGDLRNPDDWDSLIDPTLVREGVQS